MGHDPLAIVEAIRSARKQLAAERSRAGIQNQIHLYNPLYRAILMLVRPDWRSPASVERSGVNRTSLIRISCITSNTRTLAREYECGDATIWRALHSSPFAESVVP